MNKSKSLSTKQIIGLSIGIVVLLAGISLLVTWYVTSRRSYQETSTFNPGDEYRVQNRVYKIPNLPCDSSNFLILREEFMINQRDLFQRITRLLHSQDIIFWPSGGTLLGFIRHGTFMPWDDDIDVHTSLQHRNYLFSKEFSDIALASEGLEVIFLMGFNENYATREGAAVRLRIKDTIVPICDIFFVSEDPEHEERRICKIDSWNGDVLTFNDKEKWLSEWIFPIEEKTIDDMIVPLPRNPEQMLKQQYGKTVLEEMRVRSLWISHQTPFDMFSFVWTKHE
jgi:hypothetical protein